LLNVTPGKEGFGGVAEQRESTAVRLVRFIALGVPTFSRIVAVALVIVAVGLAFFDVGGYDDATRADLAILFALLALLALGIGAAVPRLVRRFLPRR
jgi:hypothetical protein